PDQRFGRFQESHLQESACRKRSGVRRFEYGGVPGGFGYHSRPAAVVRLRLQTSCRRRRRLAPCAGVPVSTDLKTQAGLAALDEIRDGMIVGWGSGSTAAIFIRELGKTGLKVRGIPTSEESRRI